MKSAEDEDAGYSSSQDVKVVLKVLGSGHRDISLVRHTHCLHPVITLGTPTRSVTSESM